MVPLTFDDSGALGALLSERSSVTPTVVAFDGAPAAGKTTLARVIAAPECAFRLSTDSYRRAGVRGARYVEGLDLLSLRADLIKCKDHFRLLVVEGICVRDTLDAVGVRPDLRVYVKVLSCVGVWNDDPD